MLSHINWWGTKQCSRKCIEQASLCRTRLKCCDHSTKSNYTVTLSFRLKHFKLLNLKKATIFNKESLSVCLHNLQIWYSYCQDSLKISHRPLASKGLVGPKRLLADRSTRAVGRFSSFGTLRLWYCVRPEYRNLDPKSGNMARESGSGSFRLAKETNTSTNHLDGKKTIIQPFFYLSSHPILLTSYLHQLDNLPRVYIRSVPLYNYNKI